MAESCDFSRKPGDYRPEPDGHFRRRKDERDFPPTAIRRCIESGEPTFEDNGRIKLTCEYIGWTFHLVIDPDKQYAVTCYPEDNSWYESDTQ